MTAVAILMLLGGLLLLTIRLPVLKLPRVAHPRPIDPHEFLSAVIEEQRSGQTPFQAICTAFASAARDRPESPEQVSELLADALPTYASLWRLLYDRGAGLLEAAEILRARLEQHRDLRGELEVKIASTRSTMRMLLWLPWAFLGVGELAGMNSLSTLLSHAWGYPLIAGAALMSWIGIRWVERMLKEALA
jgi:Flp pilus assembly protein TadB